MVGVRGQGGAELDVLPLIHLERGKAPQRHRYFGPQGVSVSAAGAGAGAGAAFFAAGFLRFM